MISVLFDANCWWGQLEIIYVLWSRVMRMAAAAAADAEQNRSQSLCVSEGERWSSARAIALVGRWASARQRATRQFWNSALWPLSFDHAQIRTASFAQHPAHPCNRRAKFSCDGCSASRPPCCISPLLANSVMTVSFLLGYQIWHLTKIAGLLLSSSAMAKAAIWPHGSRGCPTRSWILSSLTWKLNLQHEFARSALSQSR